MAFETKDYVESIPKPSNVIKTRRQTHSKYKNHPKEKEIIQAYNNGMMVKDIADRFNLSMGGLYIILNSLKTVGKRNKMYDNKSYTSWYEDISNDYKKGMSNDDIITKYGLRNPSHIYYALKKTGTKTNRIFR